jgi:WD40 repeat protein/transcriptional regulator with XRE-family HTH domain
MRNAGISVALEHFTTFGDLLKYLRRRVGLTQRELSIAVGYSHAQISRLELNQRLPDLATITALFIPALDLEEEPQAAARLVELAAAMRREDAPASGVAPFKGLQHFDEVDADLFFGREALVERLVERIIAPQTPASQAESRAVPARLQAVVGASGSGKSSILRAGLIPMLRWNPATSGWLVHTLTPTAHPLQALAGALTRESNSVLPTARLAGDLEREPRALHFFAQRLLQEQLGASGRSSPGAGARAARVDRQPCLLLGVDQFEELFTLCRDEAERQAFIDNLMAAVSEPDGCVYAVLTLRADFYAHCAPYAALRQALASRQEYIGPMSAADLRRAIEEPARRGNWQLEPGLVDLLLKDLGADGSGQAEPGGLPLLSHALLETWQRRRGRTLTISGYLASGGVHGAIAETAEVVYKDELDERQQVIARGIFLRLTELGDEDVPAETRRRASFDELVSQPEDTAAVREVLTHLADARLIVTDQEVAEVAHEALIREWPTLRGWLEENRDGLRLHRHLTLAAEGWARQGQDPGELYRGARLAQALEWAQDHQEDLNAQERAFLEASQTLAEREVEEREAQRQRELQAARTLAETQSRAADQLRRRAYYFAGAFLLALVMAGLAMFFGQQARHSAAQALDASRLATARELASASTITLEVDPQLSILLALQAISTTQDEDGTVLPEAEASLHRALLASQVRMVLSGHQERVLSGEFSPDGRRIATIGADGTTIVWDSASGEQLLSLPGTTEPGDAIGIQRLAYSPDGSILATGDRELVRLWDPARGIENATLAGHTGEVWAVVFSPDGTKIASAGRDTTARIWEVASGETIRILEGHQDAIEGLAFSPDGTLLATAADDATVRIWDVASGEVQRELADFSDAVYSVAFSPDGQHLASATEERLQIWETRTSRETLSIEVSAFYVAFSPDGRRLAASTGSAVTLWEARTGREQLTLGGHTTWVQSLAFSPDGEQLLTASLDGTARLWDITPGAEALTLVANGNRVAFSPDGERLATGGLDGIARLWDRGSGEQLAALAGHAQGLFGVAYSPDGQRLATASLDGTAKVWDTASGEELLTLAGHSHIIRDVAFGLDGRRVATASFDGTAKVWDAESGQEILTLSGHEGLVTGVAFSPNGSRLATASTDATAKIWTLPDGELLLTLSGHTDAIPDIAFNPDGTRLVTVSNDATGRVWDAETGRELFTLAGHTANIWSVAFSPDGRLIATASGDKTAKIWDAATGTELQTLPGAPGDATSVAFSPRDGGAELAVASADGTVRLYLLRLPELLDLAYARLTRWFTPEECRRYLHVEECPSSP